MKDSTGKVIHERWATLPSSNVGIRLRGGGAARALLALFGLGRAGDVLACSACAPLVRAHIFGVGFVENLASVLLPVLLVIALLAVLGRAAVAGRRNP